MALTAEQHRLREGKLTASQVKILMEGDPEAVLNLWKLHVGDPSYVEPDLSWVWPVQLGVNTEALNLSWYTHKHGELFRIGEVVVGKPEWMACTLDAWDSRGWPVECKHVSGREPLETIVARYTPQASWQMMVTGAKQCALSVIMGTNEPIVEMIPLDAEYAKELMSRAEQFMRCVETLKSPVTLPAVAAPVVAARFYDMGDNEEWKRQADRWKQSHGAAEIAKEAEKAIKAMVPADSARASGHGVVVSRNRAGSLSLRKSGDRK